MAETPGEAPAGEVRREEVRPGLVMVRARTRLPDGRRLDYFDFERTPASGETEAEPCRK